MRSLLGRTLILTTAFAVIAGSIGCQSGFKMRNPFSRTPNAANAEGPSELDELDDLTPPPENYTTSSDKKNSKEKGSLAQEGKYDSGEESKSSAKTEEYVASNTESARGVSAQPVEASYQSGSPTTLASAQVQTKSTFAPYDDPTPELDAPAPLGLQNQRELNVAQTPNSSSSALFPIAQTSATQPVYSTGQVPLPSSNAQAPLQAQVPLQTQGAPVADTFPQPSNADAFPSVETFTNDSAFPAPNDFPSIASDFPTASNNAYAAPQTTQGDVPKVAMNYDSYPAPTNASNNYPTANYSSDANSNSGVNYEPQTNPSGVFAPGSTSGYASNAANTAVY